MKHVLQVAYYPSLLETRARMLQAHGYRVTSVLGNETAQAVDSLVMSSVDVVVVGFSAPQPARQSIVGWFKTQFPTLPVVALQSQSWENISLADVTAPADDPAVWLSAVAKALGRSPS